MNDIEYKKAGSIDSNNVLQLFELLPPTLIA